jgi:hypothetical protein
MKRTLFTSILFALLSCLFGCNSNRQRPKAEDVIEAKRVQDSAIRREQAQKIIADGLYEFDKDTIRKEWIASHPYMCYYSSHFINETNGYDKNGKRITNQLLGTHDEENTICIDRRKKIIMWSWVRNGKHDKAELPIKHVDEYRDETAFSLTDSKGDKYVFSVPDNGKKITFLSYDKTIVFFVDQ